MHRLFAPCLHLWLATSQVFLDFASAQRARHLSSDNDHHDHGHHVHHHHHASKRSFGKAMRVWTPAQGPARRSASVDGRALEPFEEEAIPGWTFGRVYDIPHWDGGDRAACRNADPSSNVESSADKSKHLVPRAALPRSISDFCAEGNPPVEPPDGASCSDAPKLAKRIIPTFGQIDDIVQNAIAAGKEVHLAKVQAGIPDGPPPRPGLADAGADGGAGSAVVAQGLPGVMPGVGGAADGAVVSQSASAGLLSEGAGGDVGAMTGSQGLPAGIPMKGLLGGVGASGALPMSRRSISDSQQADKSADAVITKRHAHSQLETSSLANQDGSSLTKRLLFGWIEDIVNNAVSAGKDVNMARIQSEAGAGRQSLSLRKRLVPSADQIEKFFAGLQGNDSTSHDSQAPDKSSVPTKSGSVDSFTGSSRKNQDTKVHQLIGGDNSPTAPWSGSVPTAQNTKPLPGTFLIAQGKSPADMNHPAASRRGISEPEVSEAQLYNLVSAAFRTASDINAASASGAEHGKAKRDASQVVLQRSPLGPMMAMEGMMGGGGGGIMTMITTLMPAILAAIKAAGQVGVAFIQFNEGVQVEKLKEEAQRNATMLEEDKLKEINGGRTSGASVGTHAKAVSSSGAFKRHLDTHASWASRSNPSDRCGGTARLCMGFIQSALEFCLPDSQHTSQEDRYHHTSSNLVRTMTAHCLLKCDGFGQLVKTDRTFESKAERCSGDTHLLQKIYSIGSSTKSSQTAKHGGRADSLRKRSQPPYCQMGYQSIFTDARRPVASYSNKLFGSVVSDPTAFLHWGLVSSISQCLSACDATSGCVFVNIYQQTFNLDNPSIKLINRAPDAVAFKELPEVGDDWERKESERLKRKFAGKREDKKNSFVQGQLTCALYSRCHAECDANRASGSGEPIFFESSQGWCKSKDCDAHGQK
ncbi:hypothetical protein PHSY_004254 [Pseudozyma hubeiensis SY62]|uniref:Apple domain-containing protein n=1 Tax=Pseudozyma hubeiensis (strain SY62) TaxID=1305764 RepID=R9P5N6_PSEHS|nr:hypothetical protein PHSY_004254 [Pseudozyma hubeiensis SY62]GAC96671.1 hypothetical protein PHSY_004254 [Pseudozyma hubeiensis SY62]